MDNREIQRETAEKLEQFLIAATEAVRLLREGQSDSKAYALVYMLRRRFGYIVRSMGRANEPYPQDRGWAESVIESALYEVTKDIKY